MPKDKKHRRADLGGTHEGHVRLLKLPRKFQKHFLGDFDKRTIIFQHLNDGYMEILDDLGGEENCSHIKTSLVEKYVWLEFMMKHLESRIAKRVSIGKSSTKLFNNWLYASQRLGTLAHRLGIERVAKKIDSSLSEYVGKKKRRKNA